MDTAPLRVRYRGHEAVMQLDEQHLEFVDERRNITLRSMSLSDVIGARVVSEPHRKQPFVDVYSYPREASCCSSGHARRARHATFEVLGASPGDALAQAHRWAGLIRRRALPLIHDTTHHHTTTHPHVDPKEVSEGDQGPVGGMQRAQAPQSRKFMVFVNPVSGSGKAQRIYSATVEPMLEQAALDYECVVTTHPLHAMEHVRDTPDLAQYYGVVVVGGDGMLAEVLQGVHERPDASEILSKVTFGIVCAGSGNGLAKSVLFEAQEAYGPLASTFVCIKGEPQPMDLSQVATTDSTHLSFLCLAWALVSDVDIESEVLRWMGSARFTVYALQRIVFLRRYTATLSYLPIADYQSNPSAFNMPPLEDPLPANWNSVESEFLAFWVCQTSHAAHDMYTCPGASLSDGKLTVMMVKSHVTRARLLGLFLALEDGSHVDNPDIEFIDVAAYRLEPHNTERGIYSLDGEVVTHGPLQGHILPSAAKVFGGPSALLEQPPSGANMA